MAKVKLTEKKLKALKTSQYREEFWDESFQGGKCGFAVRVYGAGKKIYFLSYRNKRGQRRRLSLGDASVKSLGVVRREARELAVKIENGEDPAQEKLDHRGAITVKRLCHDYIEFHAKPNKKPSSCKEDQRIINYDILPKWGNWKAIDVTRRDVISLLDEIRIKRNTKVQPNRTRALIHRLFNFALHREYIGANPCSGLPKMIKEQPRDRVLDDTEINLLLEKLDNEPDFTMKAIFKVILLTGQRPGEVKGMRWSEVNENEAVWDLPKERSKNNLPHKVPISKAVLKILSEIKVHNAELKSHSRKSEEEKKHYDEFVFPSRYGGPVTWLNKKAQKLVKDMEVERWTPHDLRRTMATHLENLGVSSEVISRLQNHKKQGMSAIYQHGRPWEQMVKAMNKWTRYVEQITLPETSQKVVPLHG